MKPEVKAEYDILAEQMDKDDNIKRRTYQFAQDNGFDNFTPEMNQVLAAYMYDKCRPWREIPRVRKKILKTARIMAKNKLKKSAVVNKKAK